MNIFQFFFFYLSENVKCVQRSFMFWQKLPVNSLHDICMFRWGQHTGLLPISCVLAKEFDQLRKCKELPYHWLVTHQWITWWLREAVLTFPMKNVWQHVHLFQKMNIRNLQFREQAGDRENGHYFCIVELEVMSCGFLVFLCLTKTVIARDRLWGLSRPSPVKQAVQADTVPLHVLNKQWRINQTVAVKVFVVFELDVELVELLLCLYKGAWSASLYKIWTSSTKQV